MEENACNSNSNYHKLLKMNRRMCSLEGGGVVKSIKMDMNLFICIEIVCKQISTGNEKDLEVQMNCYNN